MPFNIDAPKVFSMFPDSNDLRLVVTDKEFYPSKEMIEQSYGFSSKLSSEHTSKNRENILEIYRLEDHQEDEITVSELVKRYLSSPELCFRIGWDEMEQVDPRELEDL